MVYRHPSSLTTQVLRLTHGLDWSWSLRAVVFVAVVVLASVPDAVIVSWHGPPDESRATTLMPHWRFDVLRQGDRKRSVTTASLTVCCFDWSNYDAVSHRPLRLTRRPMKYDTNSDLLCVSMFGCVCQPSINEHDDVSDRFWNAEKSRR